jgi:hypothetical protein
LAGWTKTSGVNGAAAGATLSLGAVAAGQFIRCCIRIGAGGSAPTVADDKDGSYTSAVTGQTDGLGDKCYEFYLYPTVSTASRTVTVTSAGGTIRIIASWFTPPTGTTGVSVSASNGGSAHATSAASGNATAASGDLVAGAAITGNAANFDWTAGGTSAGGTWATDQDFNAASHPLYSQYVVASAGGTFVSQPVYGGTEDVGSTIVVYNATISSGTKAPPFQSRPPRNFLLRR